MCDLINRNEEKRPIKLSMRLILYSVYRDATTICEDGSTYLYYSPTALMSLKMSLFSFSLVFLIFRVISAWLNVLISHRNLIEIALLLGRVIIFRLTWTIEQRNGAWLSPRNFKARRNAAQSPSDSFAKSCWNFPPEIAIHISVCDNKHDEINAFEKVMPVDLLQWYCNVYQ